MGTKKTAAAGEEIWLNTLAGTLYYFTTDRNGKRRGASVRGGKTFRVTEYDRELMSDEIADDERNPFLNGRLKRVDDRIAASDPETGEVNQEDAEAGKTPLPDGHKVEQALEGDDLLDVLNKNGMAFQSAVKKLDERNVRALKALTKRDGVEATVKQVEFLDAYIQENFRAGGATTTGIELLSDPRG